MHVRNIIARQQRKVSATSLDLSYALANSRVIDLSIVSRDGGRENLPQVFMYKFQRGSPLSCNKT